MSSFFVYNNLHFTLELLGALAFLTVAWLAADSFKVRKDFTTASRGIGFAFLTIWQVVHALGFASNTYNYLGYGFYFLGLIFIIVNLWLEKPAKRPEFKAVLVLPSVSALAVPFAVSATAGLFAITLLSFRQYKKELKKTLMPFSLGFLFLTIASFASVFYKVDVFDAVWILGHVFELLGFFAIAWWVWSYLQLRIREEMLLVLVSITLFMAVIVSLTFSTILLGRVEKQTEENLLVNTRVLGFVIDGLQQEALAKAKFLAKRDDIAEALVADDFVRMNELLVGAIEEENLGFLTVLNQYGEVVLRAHAVSGKGESLLGERAAGQAMKGRPFVTIETSPVEKFSIRAASPIIEEGEIIGAVVAGFMLDNILVDKIKKISGLEMSIFENEKRVATTIFNLNGKTRSVGIKETDARVLSAVLEGGGEAIFRTNILSRPFFASYLPIYSADSEIVGMISAAQPQFEIFKTTQATNRLTITVAVIIMLILSMPIYFVTRRLGEEV